MNRFQGLSNILALFGLTILLSLSGCTSGETPYLNEALSQQALPVSATLHTMRFSNAQGWHTQSYYYETIRFPDINGDRRADICGRSANGLECSFGQGSAFSSLTQSYPDHFSNAQGWHNHPSYWQTIQYPDVNGDGRSDVCGRGAAGMYCAVASTTGSGFGPLRLWSGDFSDNGLWKTHPSYWKTIQFADVNRDQKYDVCGRYVGGIYCALSNGLSFAPATLWTSSFGNASLVMAADAFYATIRFPDVNGDRQADVCGRGSGGVYCALNTGTTFGPLSLWTPQFSDHANWQLDPAYWSTLQFADVNGDSKVDVCGRGVRGMYCGRSTGTAFAGTTTLHLPEFSDLNGWTLAQHYETIRVIDVNGDGKADICGRGFIGIYCAQSRSFPGTIVFDPVYLRIDNFRDNDGWHSSPAYWKTILPVNLDATAGYEFCGRGDQGIMCSND